MQFSKALYQGMNSVVPIKPTKSTLGFSVCVRAPFALLLRRSCFEFSAISAAVFVSGCPHAMQPG
ncbi:MAG: hypothetical protein ABR976_18330, partial [Terracidiphilus sp.]